jgi:hypothetical protein
MLWFNEAKNYGFIRTEAEERLQVYREDFVDGVAPVGRCAGLPVRLTVDERHGERIAIDVSFPVDEVPRRARRRSSGRSR